MVGLTGETFQWRTLTNCERIWNERGEIAKSLKADSIRRECEASLRRLKLDVIDLYQIHWPEPDEDIEEGWMALAKLKEEGKVRFIGVSNFNVDQMKRAQRIAPVTSLQPPDSLLAPEVEDAILPYARAHNIGVIVYSPMRSGLLSGKVTRERVAALPADDFRRSHAALSGAEAVAQPGTGRAAASDRTASRPLARRGGDRVDAAASRRDTGDRGDALGRAGGWRDRRGGLPAERGGAGRDRGLLRGRSGGFSRDVINTQA